ncbi:multidrug efflux protein [Opitutaceae bacterium EW11]|nr:multidrug efflux protein [Opitutaceae bacterium EW11]
MRFTDLFIRRPILATVVNVFLLLGGWLCFKSMVVRQYPKTNNAVVTVTTNYPGASADLIRGFITTPLEREIASADGIDFLESASAPNTSIITAKLRLNYDPNAALTQITSKVNRVRSELPAAAEDPIFDVALGETMASMYLSFSSESMEANQITDYLVRVVQPKLAAIEGVQKAEILGGRTFAMRIWMKEDRMAALGISPSMLRAKLASQNSLSAVGQTKGNMVSVNLNAKTDLHTAEEFRQMVVLEKDGRIVRLRDVADVMLGAENYDTNLTFNGVTATGMSINVLPTANSVDVIKRVRAAWPDIVSQFPPGLKAAVLYDATEFINLSISEVIHTIVEAMLIVVVVIYLFLGSFRSVVIPIVAIPLSLVGAGILMLSFGFSVNLLTLLAMVLAIGLVVDDAIVVVENIHRHIEEGLSPTAAALKGAHELVGPVIAMTITLAAVYAPIGLQSGVTGALFREFAFTLAGSVVVSGFVALTLTPMLSSKLLRHNPNRRGFEALLERAFETLRGFYERLLEKVLGNRAAVVVAAVVVFASIVPFFLFSQSELAPAEDRGVVIGIIGGAPNASLDQSARHVGQLQPMIERLFPEMDVTFNILGFDPTTGLPNPSGGMNAMVLKPWNQRARGAGTIAAHYTAAAGNIAGITAAGILPPSLPGASSGLPVQFVVGSTQDHARIFEVSNELMKRALASGMFVYADNALKYDQPQSDIVIDKDKAALLGIDMSQLGADLGSMLGGGYVNRFSIDGRAYKVTPQVTRLSRLTTDQLNDFYIPTGSGKLVPLSTVASFQTTTQPRSLARFQQLNCATLGLVPRPGVTTGDALKWLNNEAKQIFPEGFSADYKGELRQYVQEGSSLMTTFALALVVIFLVLAAQYESWRDPFIILMAVPLSLAGAMVFIFLGFATLNIYTEVGLITLVGLITKHGILMVDFANGLQEQGHTVREAIEHAAGVRLRPILMTTAAMVLGVLPLVFAKGAGAESRYSMGLVIATGMSIGTAFTLFVLPVFYTFISKKRREEKPSAAVATPHA